jgi:hypothetical protein
MGSYFSRSYNIRDYSKALLNNDVEIITQRPEVIHGFNGLIPSSLYYCYLFNKEDLIEYLLKIGASFRNCKIVTRVNIKQEFIREAEMNQYMVDYIKAKENDIIKFLIENGHRTDFIIDGKSYYDIAIECGNTEIAELFREKIET